MCCIQILCKPHHTHAHDLVILKGVMEAREMSAARPLNPEVSMTQVYFMQLEFLFNRLAALTEQIEDTEDLIRVDLTNMVADAATEVFVTLVTFNVVAICESGVTLLN